MARVCIVGGGVQGLVALKNLVELNNESDPIFEAEILESRSNLGGIWNFSSSPEHITALQSTLNNITVIRNVYSDYHIKQFWKDTGRGASPPLYLNQEEELAYLEQYARKFNLNKYIRFGCRVTGLTRASENQKWEVTVLDVNTGTTKIEQYQKVIIATGQYALPHIPKIAGIENFRGDALHSNGFKDPQRFKGRRVLIVGSSNTAADTSEALTGIATSVHLSHRRGALIFPRYLENGKPILESISTRRLASIKLGITSLAPIFFTHKFNGMIAKISNQIWKARLKAEWNLSPVPSPSFCRPMISDSIIPSLEAGLLKLVPAIDRVLENGDVRFVDGVTISVDSIIFCTGYVNDKILTSMVQCESNLDLPRLYQNIYHPDYPDSLAFMTFWHVPSGVHEIADVLAMGIAQVFSGRYKLPGEQEMEKQIKTLHAFVCGLAERVEGPIASSAAQKLVDEGPWRKFLNDAAGTQVNEKLGYGIAGWRFWWEDRQLCNLIMGGVETPHIYRLFDGREPGCRPKWEGARKAIEDSNQMFKDVDNRLIKSRKIK